MDPLLLGLVVGVATVVMLFSGIPIAFGLCFISVVFLVIAEGFSILNVFHFSRRVWACKIIWSFAKMI